MLEQVEAGELVYDLKMNVLQAIQYIIQGWDEITANTIQNCWNHVKILPDASFPDDIYEDDDLMLDDELTRAIEALNLSNRMGVREFITIPEEEEVYEIPEILEIADLFKDRKSTRLNSSHSQISYAVFCLKKKKKKNKKDTNKKLNI